MRRYYIIILQLFLHDIGLGGKRRAQACEFMYCVCVFDGLSLAASWPVKPLSWSELVYHTRPNQGRGGVAYQPPPAAAAAVAGWFHFKNYCTVHLTVNCT